jgi:hypothetical protein
MAYPATYDCDFVEERSRLTTFFRFILAIPLAIVGIFYGIGALLAVIAAWFAVVFTGQYPEGLYKFISGYVRWSAQFNGYCYLLTDKYAPFSLEEDDYPIRMHFTRLVEYSRWKTLLRIILFIPIYIALYVLSILIFLGAVAVTGKMPKGLQDLLVLGSAFNARATAYGFLLTETYPPFQEDALPGAGGAAAIPQATDPTVPPPAVPQTPPVDPDAPSGP